MSIQEGIYLEAYVGSALNSYANQFSHYEEGLEVNDWIKSREVIGDFFATKWARNWWKEYGEARFGGSFVTEINKILDENLGDADYMRKISKSAIDT